LFKQSNKGKPLYRHDSELRLKKNREKFERKLKEKQESREKLERLKKEKRELRLKQDESLKSVV